MVNVIECKYETNFYRFAVDTVAELDLLPKINTKGKDILNTIGSCAVGSTAIVTENSDEYILNGEQNKWIKRVVSSGGGSGDSSGGGTSPETYDIATDDEIRNIFS